MKIGILGGTFDPIHNGHIRLAELAYKQFGLDEVWLVPAPIPPFKPSSCEASYEDRLYMTQLAVGDRPGLVCSDYESHLNLGERSYTADTLSALKKERPEDELYLIIGADSLYTIDTWYKPEVIFSNASLIVAVRRYDVDHPSPEQAQALLEEKYGARIYFIDSEEYDVSSTEIRKRITEGESIQDLVPYEVNRYIWQHRLYLPREGWIMDRSELYRIREKLSRELPEKRYQHSLGVEFTAAALAMRYGVDVQKAELAGLVHDCAKVIYNETKVAHAEHAPEIAQSMYDVHDPEVLNAIRWHTTGKADMTVLEKIIYVADFIEPCRKFFPELPEARKMAFIDLTATVYYIADRTIRYLEELGADIDPKTRECVEYLKENGTHD